MSDYDVIIRMDWLTVNEAKIDSYRKTITLCPPNGFVVKFSGHVTNPRTNIIFTLRDEKLIIRGRDTYLSCVLEDKKEQSRIEETLIIKKFSNVFLDNIPRLPPKKYVHFTVELALGRTPISQHPYKMVLAELKELKDQLEELLEK